MSKEVEGCKRKDKNEGVEKGRKLCQKDSGFNCAECNKNKKWERCIKEMTC